MESEERATTPTPTSSEVIRLIDVFKGWLEANGVSYPEEFEIVPVEWGLGVIYVEKKHERPTKRVKLDETKAADPLHRFKITIPQKLLMHPHFNDELNTLLKRVDNYKDLWEEMCERGSHLVRSLDLLAIYWYLVRERRNPQSFWKPYLDILQSQFDTPLYWNEEELQMIKGTNLLEGTEKIKQWLQNALSIICKMDETVELKDVVWAYTVFSSRAIGVNKNDNMKEYECDINSSNVVPSLVPFVDILNHHPDSKVKFLTDNESQSFSFELECSPVDGKELWNNYGAKTNEQFLLSYGFLQDPKFGSYWVQVAILEHDPLKLHKGKLLKDLKLCNRYYFTKTEIPADFFLVVQILLLDEIDYMFLPTTTHKNQFHISSTKNQLTTYATIIQLLQARLNRFTSPSTDEDKKQLLDPNISFKKRLALSYLIEQKEILQAVIVNVKEMQTNFITQNCTNTHKMISYLHQNMDTQKLNSDGLLNKLHLSYSAGELLLNLNLKDGERNGPYGLEIAEEDIICVSNFLSEDSFLSIVLGHCADNEIQLEEDVVLSLILINEKRKKEKSKWFHFISALPETFQNALYYNDTHFDLLEKTSLAEIAMDIQGFITDQLFVVKSIQKQFPNLLPITFFTRESLKWAYTVSLVFGVDVKTTEGNKRCILPFLPGYNHLIAPILKNSSPNKFNYSTFLTDGKVVCNYEQKTNEDLLISHGIFVEKNPFDYLKIDFRKFLRSDKKLPDSIMSTHFFKCGSLSSQLVTSLENNHFALQSVLKVVQDLCQSVQDNISKAETLEDNISTLIKYYLQSQLLVLVDVEKKIKELKK